nr:hypothetical protein [Chamaesiphon polymorphus]
MTRQSPNNFPAADILDLNRAIDRGAQTLPCLAIPQFDRSIEATGGNQSIFVANSDRPDPIFMPLQYESATPAL